MPRRLSRTAREMIDAGLNPLAQVQLQRRDPLPGAARFRGKTRLQVTSCTECELRKSQPEGQAPVPYYSETKNPRFVVLGEAPGPEESRRGRPFVGPSGKLLKAYMRDAGINYHEVMYTNTVSCFPNVEGKVRAPSDQETLACRNNAECQIEAGDVPLIVLVGGKALAAFRKDLQVTRDHGRCFIWRDLYMVMPIVHPAAVLRGQKQYAKMIVDDLTLWADVVEEWWQGGDVLRFLGTTCVKCNGVMYAYDRDGVPWCKEHFEKWGKLWEKERSRWYQERAEQLTF